MAVSDVFLREFETVADRDEIEPQLNECFDKSKFDQITKPELNAGIIGWKLRAP